MKIARCVIVLGISLELNTYGKNVIFYLAAAVSDFFIPDTDMVSFSSRVVALHAYFCHRWLRYMT